MCRKPCNLHCFCMFDIDFVQKHWFLQHSVGVALCSPRGPEANFDKCFTKSKEICAPPIAPEMQITMKGRDRATKKQGTRNHRATAEQPPSNDFTNPYPSLKILLKKNLDRTTEKTEQRRQNPEDRTAETQNHSRIV